MVEALENENDATVAHEKTLEIHEKTIEVHDNEVNEEKVTSVDEPEVPVVEDQAPLASMESDPAPLASLDSATSSDLQSMWKWDFECMILWVTFEKHFEKNPKLLCIFVTHFHDQRIISTVT